MKKLLLTLAFLLSFSCFVTVPTHACEDCDGAHVTVFALEDETATPFATNCICGGTRVYKTISTNYSLTSKTSCIHGNGGLDYNYKVTTVKGLVCQSCGAQSNLTTTTSTYVSCGKPRS